MKIKLNDVLGVIVFICSIVGSTMVASNSSFSKFGYMIFLIGGISSIKIMLESNIHRSIFVTQLYFICIDIVGIYRFF